MLFDRTNAFLKKAILIFLESKKLKNYTFYLFVMSMRMSIRNAIKNPFASSLYIFLLVTLIAILCLKDQILVILHFSVLISLLFMVMVSPRIYFYRSNKAYRNKVLQIKDILLNQKFQNRREFELFRDTIEQDFVLCRKYMSKLKWIAISLWAFFIYLVSLLFDLFINNKSEEAVDFIYVVISIEIICLIYLPLYFMCEKLMTDFERVVKLAFSEVELLLK